MTFKLCVVVKLCSGTKLSLVETLKQIQNAPADHAHDVDLEIDLHDRLFPELTKDIESNGLKPLSIMHQVT